MPEPIIFLEYSGRIDYKTIDQLLKTLKKSRDYVKLPRITAKRVYAILVEILENIVKHSIKNYPGESRSHPFVSVGLLDQNIYIKAGNPIYSDRINKLTSRLDKVNWMDEGSLSVLYDKIINKETKVDDNGAGLGFILMKIKSRNRIEFSFTEAAKDVSYFFLQVTINKYNMRKLIIEQTSSSPRVILDPERYIFELSGESRPPDVATFYLDILRWFDEFTLYLGKQQEIKDPLIIKFDFEYFNSSSAKYILDLCKQIASVRTKGIGMTVNWHYEKDDTDMLEAGKEMSRIAKFPFDFVQRN
jgi:hypothetical protein